MDRGSKQYTGGGDENNSQEGKKKKKTTKNQNGSLRRPYKYILLNSEFQRIARRER